MHQNIIDKSFIIKLLSMMFWGVKLKKKIELANDYIPIHETNLFS